LKLLKVKQINGNLRTSWFIDDENRQATPMMMIPREEQGSEHDDDKSRHGMASEPMILYLPDH
jgi:hypothetical protein